MLYFKINVGMSDKTKLIKKFKERNLILSTIILIYIIFEIPNCVININLVSNLFLLFNNLQT